MSLLSANKIMMLCSWFCYIILSDVQLSRKELIYFIATNVPTVEVEDEWNVIF